MVNSFIAFKHRTGMKGTQLSCNHGEDTLRTGCRQFWTHPKRGEYPMAYSSLNHDGMT